MSRSMSTSGRSPVRQALTPGDITEFVQNCFTPALCDVDFTQALRCIEYLTVLDDRRKREVCSALRRLNIDEANVAQQKEALKETSPKVYERVCYIDERSRKAEALYTQVYIGLRRWALINEMRLMPFNKKSSYEVLDELYPSKYSTLPTPQLTQLILDNQRDAFSKYIRSVEKFGRSVLKNLENQSKRPADSNGWPVVREILERYLRNTSRVIEVCASTKGPDMFERASPRTSPQRSPSKEHSRPGISHSTTYPGPPLTSNSRRPSTSSSHTAPPMTTQLKKEQLDWLHQQQLLQQANGAAQDQPSRQLKKSSSTLGRLANEFRRMKSKSADSRTEQPGHVRSHSAMENRPPMLRSRPSHGTNMSREPSRDGRKHSRSNSTDQNVTCMVQIDDAYRERLIQEAKRNKLDQENKRQNSPTHFKLEQDRRYQPTPRVRDGPEDEDCLFFITDAATRFTPMNDTRPFAAPRQEPLIAELAA